MSRRPSANGDGETSGIAEAIDIVTPQAARLRPSGCAVTLMGEVCW